MLLIVGQVTEPVRADQYRGGIGTPCASAVLAGTKGSVDVLAANP